MALHAVTSATHAEPRRLAALLAFALALLLGGCGGGGGGGGSTPTPTPTPTVITTQPAAQSAGAGGSVSFVLAASGESLRYQWQRSTDGGGTWADIAGATAASYTIAAVDATMDGWQFRAVVTGSAGSVTSAAVTLDVAPEPAFTALTATLPAARASHTATLLPDGKVLITGGVAIATLPAPALSSALIYDPVTGTSTPLTATLRVPRISHTATLLRSGLVLITGGQVTDNDGDGDNSAELYDPATQTFTLLPATMVSPRGEHSATLLEDGTVLLAGGFNGGPGTLVSDAELYDPVTRSFSAIAGRMVSTSGRQAAALLPGGKVLLAGGSSSSAAQIYDPATRSFSALAATMSAERAAATATLLPSGKVLIAGGGTLVPADLASSVTLDSAELFDPVAGTFTPLTARMAAPRLMHTATLLPDGTVLFTGGGLVGSTYTPTVPWALYDSMERYGP